MTCVRWQRLVFGAGALVIGGLAWYGASNPERPHPRPPQAVTERVSVKSESRAMAQSPGPLRLWLANQRLIELHNRARRDEGKPALVVNFRLVRAAADHARDLASRDVLSHFGPDGSDLGTRIDRVGYRARLAAENVAAQWPLPQGWPDPRTPEWALEGWMRSPGHRANVVGPYTDFGAAYADTSRGKRYWVVVFGQPSK